MISGISEYAGEIITLIVAMTIIELLLPNNKNKKYVMFVCSLIMMLVVIEPILNFLDKDFDISSKVSEIQKKIKEAEDNAIEVSENTNSFNQKYIENLEEDVTQRLNEIGYEVLEAKISMNESNYEPEAIEMKIKHKDGSIQPIIIDVFGNETSDELYLEDKNKIKSFISQNYGIKKDKVKINEIEKRN